LTSKLTISAGCRRPEEAGKGGGKSGANSRTQEAKAADHGSDHQVDLHPQIKFLDLNELYYRKVRELSTTKRTALDDRMFKFESSRGKGRSIERRKLSRQF